MSRLNPAKPHVMIVELFLWASMGPATAQTRRREEDRDPSRGPLCSIVHLPDAPTCCIRVFPRASSIGAASRQADLVEGPNICCQWLNAQQRPHQIASPLEVFQI
ncbi:hypothetical protein K438DRAFT_1762388 [Mycena galopus ATCC 62051]|nr:hypothetical protein K438DRAFT_1762388 [Mycena galopus ATCC 62051]